MGHFKGLESIEIKPKEEIGGVKSGEVEEIRKVAFESLASKIDKLNKEIALVEIQIKEIKKESQDLDNNTNFKKSVGNILGNLEDFLEKRNQNNYDILIKKKERLELERKSLTESN